MNEELFRPKGLYCFIMAYDTNSATLKPSEHVDEAIDTSQFTPADMGSPKSAFRGDDGTMAPWTSQHALSLSFLVHRKAILITTMKTTSTQDQTVREMHFLASSRLGVKRQTASRR